MKKSIFCILGVILAVTACGKDPQVREREETVRPPRQESGEEESNLEISPDDFWLQASAEAGSRETVLSFATGLKIVLPEDWEDKFVTSIDPGWEELGDTFFVCEKRNAEAGVGGILFFLEFVNRKIAAAAPYEIFGTDKVLGVYEMGGEEYALIYSIPREMNYVEGDERMQEAYESLYGSLDEVQIFTDHMKGFTECGMEDVDWIIDGQ